MAEYIEREAAHRMVAGLVRYSWKSLIRTECRSTLGADDVNFGLDKIPAADVAPVVHGRWVPPAVGKYGCICSVCKKQSDNGYDYCPNCGAKMDLNNGKACPGPTLLKNA